MQNYTDKNIILILANGEPLEIVTPFIRNLNVTENFNNTCEISFDLLEKIIDKGIEYKVEFYETIENKRRFLLEDVGEYVVSNVVEENNGLYRFKTISCKSCEYEFNNIYTSFKNSASLYLQTPIVNNFGIMNHVLEYFPEWTIEYIDPLLENKTRYFDIKKQRLYQFMINDIESSFDCIFTFDTINKKIKLEHLSNATKESDIYLSYDALVKHTSITPTSDEVFTVLDITGGNLDIRRVNPTGTNFIYNFTYYMDTKWMSQELINAIETWQLKIIQYQNEYSNLFEQYSAIQGQINTIEPLYDEAWDLFVQMNDQYLAMKSNLGDPYTQQDLDNAFNEMVEQSWIYADYGDQLWGYNIEGNGLYGDLDVIDIQLDNINNICKMESNFTLAQQNELRPFMNYGDYENKAFSYVEGMTENDKKEISKLLYAQGKIHSDRVCKPRLSFDIDVVNFTKMLETKEFTKELKTGLYIYVQFNESSIGKLILTSINTPDAYGNPKDIKLTFSDKLRYTDDLSVLHELLNEVTRKLKETEEQKIQIEDINKKISGIGGSITNLNNRFDKVYESITGTNKSVAEIKQEILVLEPQFGKYDTIPTAQQIIDDEIIIGDVVLVKVVV